MNFPNLKENFYRYFLREKNVRLKTVASAWIAFRIPQNYAWKAHTKIHLTLSCQGLTMLEHFWSITSSLSCQGLTILEHFWSITSSQLHPVILSSCCCSHENTKLVSFLLASYAFLTGAYNTEKANLKDLCLMLVYVWFA